MTDENELTRSDHTHQLTTDETKVVERAGSMTKAAAILAALVLVGLVAIQFQVIQQGDHINRVESSTGRVEVSVEELRTFVRQVQAESESETSIAQDRAIKQAVAEVPKIKSILCEAFPDATACQEETP